MGVSGSSRRGYLIPDMLTKKRAAGIGRCFFKQPSKVQVWVACQKSILKLECKGSRVLMMNTNGYLEDNNGSSKAVAFWRDPEIMLVSAPACTVLVLAPSLSHLFQSIFSVRVLRGEDEQLSGSKVFSDPQLPMD
ncbi:uncharacterized protein [Taeniopygia guttata]|uniref:uncharacterized protein isoform X2 n=1 Tax=Taeniopygia guttata TaxID=59729 RepID=UPI003BB8858F